MTLYDNPDAALARWMAMEEERAERERRSDRIADHTPAGELPSCSTGQHRNVAGKGARITSAMATLAWTVLHGSWHDAREASRVLAELILEAVGE